MSTFTITGITQTNDFRVYTGVTPFNVVFYDNFPYYTTEVTLENLPNNFKFYFVIENIVTNYRTIKVIVTDSAYCEDICFGVFSIDVTFPPTPTISVTPTLTPTISVTPSISVTPTPSHSKSLVLTATPTVTPTISLTRSVTPTPTVTPTISQAYTCGYYSIIFDVEETDISVHTLYYYYVDCTTGITVQTYIGNQENKEHCIQESGGVPLIYFEEGYSQYITLIRISNCGNS